MLTTKIIFWLSLFFLIYSYVFYPLLLALLAKIWKVKEFKLSSELPKLSLIIAAYNEEKVIKGRIENCLNLDYPQDSLEIIIASDGSSDKTNEIVREYQSRGIILLDFENRRGKVNVLNEIVPQAKHSIVVFSDANTMFKRDALKKLVRYFGDSRVGCVCGGLQFVNAKGSNTGELEGVYWRYETMIKKFEGRRGSLLGVNGAIFAIRKECYYSCPPDTIVEDFVMPMKILEKGHAVVYEPEAIAIEEAAHKIIHEKQRRIRIGAGDFQALFRLLPMLNPFRGFPALAFWSHKVLRWFAPFFLIICFFTNLSLFAKEPVYAVIFIIQCVFYGCAFIGQMFSWSGINIKLFSLCYYFVSMNLALLLGFVRYLTGRQNVKWQRTER